MKKNNSLIQEPILENDLKEIGIVKFSLNKNINKKIDTYSTGSYFLDKALNIGGWPRGKICEIYGNDSSGKSTLALHTIATAQKDNKKCVYIDLENTFNHIWAEKLNVDLKSLYLCTPNSGEQTFAIINKLVKTKRIDLIVVDSVTAMVPNLEFVNNIEDQTMGLHARLMSKGLRILQSNLINSNTTIVFINQIREKMGNSYISTTTTTGGRALRYSSCARVEIRRCESIKQQEKIIGFVTKAIVIKNKYGSPMQTANLALYFDSGFDHYYEIISEALNKKIIDKKGSWFSYKNENIGQGISETRNKLKNNNELFEEIKNAVISS